MLQRLLGLLLIIRALAPILAVILIAVVAALVISDVQAALDEPLRGISDQIDVIKGSIADVQTDFAAMQQNVTEVVNRLQSFSIPNLLPNLPTSLNFPSLHIPNPSISVPTVSVTWSSALGITYPSAITVGSKTVTIPIPDIPAFSVNLPFMTDIENAFRGALSSITDMFGIFDDAFASINQLTTTLKTIPDSVNAIVTDARNVWAGLQDFASQWGGRLAVALIILLGLAVIYFTVPVIDDFTRGWRMLRGLAAD